MATANTCISLVFFLIVPFVPLARAGTDLLPCFNQTLPCNGRGNCSLDDERNEPKCECSAEFGGQACEDRDYCAVNPCVNGKCKVWYGNYKCDCSADFHTYAAEEFHFLNNIHSSTLPARREFHNPRIPLFRAVSDRNPNWKRRLSVFFFFDNRPCTEFSRSRHPNASRLVCPTNYDKMWTALNRQLHGKKSHFSTFFNVTIREREAEPNCPLASRDHFPRYSPRCHSNGFCGYDGKCRCWQGFAGYYCEDRDFCADQPCANGGTCDVWFGNFRCVCPKGFHGPQCEHKANPKAVQQANEQDVWETIFDLKPTGASTAAKINCFFSSARWFHEMRVLGKRAVIGKARSLPILYLPACERAYYDFFDGYNVTDMPWYVGHSPANPHWNKRVSAFIYMSTKDCKPKNQSHRCPTSYLQAFDQAKAMSGTWYKDHSFDIKVRPSSSAICAVPSSWSGLWFFLWLVSTLGVFLGAWTAAPRYSPQVNGHLRQLWGRVKGRKDATVELNEMLLQNNGGRR
ncbi:hypothetical protein M3Y99_01367400 [Aphelenchoides fujianensis]|nr:hypothetical protein M3Y99_01367400 [Aphelenchoides fujianensis]